MNEWMAIVLLMLFSPSLHRSVNRFTFDSFQFSCINPSTHHSSILSLIHSTDQHDFNKQNKRITLVILQRRPEWEESPPWKRYRMDFPSSQCTQCRNALEQKLAHPTINHLTYKKVHQNSHKRRSANYLLHSDPIYDHPSSSWESTRTAQTPR